MVFEVAPLDARVRFAKPHSRRVVGIGSGGKGQLVFELDAIAPAVVQVDVGNLVVRLAGIVVGDPAKVDLPMMIAGCSRVVGNEGRPALRASKCGERKGREEQKNSQAGGASAGRGTCATSHSGRSRKVQDQVSICIVRATEPTGYSGPDQPPLFFPLDPMRRAALLCDTCLLCRLTTCSKLHKKLPDS